MCFTFNLIKKQRLCNKRNICSHCISERNELKSLSKLYLDCWVENLNKFEHITYIVCWTRLLTITIIIMMYLENFYEFYFILKIEFKLVIHVSLKTASLYWGCHENLYLQFLCSFSIHKINISYIGRFFQDVFSVTYWAVKRDS